MTLPALLKKKKPDLTRDEWIAVADAMRSIKRLVDGMDKSIDFGYRETISNAVIQHLYVRVTRRAFFPLDIGMVGTLEIANIVIAEGTRDRGFFAVLLDQIEGLADERGRHVFVECVANGRLQGFLRRRQYREIFDHTPSFVRPPRRS